MENNVNEVMSMLLTTQSGKSEKIRACMENVKIILENDNRFKGRLVYNKIDMKVYKMEPFPWDDEKELAKMPGIYGQIGMYPYNDKMDTLQIKRLIQRDYYQNTGEIDCEIISEAIRHTVHPVRSIIESLEWDGKDHIKNLLPTYLGVDPDEYQEKALKLMMVTMVTRMYTPGAKMDCILALTGDQGIGKSSFCRKLAFDDLTLFTDRLGDLTNKDTLQLVAGKLVIELGEMLACKKTREIEAVKSFLSSCADTYRAPYDRTWEDHLRQCILIATTNEDAFLSDVTGDRRWIAIECHADQIKKDINFDPDAMKEIMQAWAEAYHIYKAEKPDLVKWSLELAPEAKRHAEKHKEQDPRVGIIGEYLDELKRTQEKPRVCTMQIQHEVFHEYDTDRWKNKDIAKILTFEFPEWKKSDKKQRCGEYGVQVVWETDPVTDEQPRTEMVENFYQATQIEVVDLKEF